MRSYSHRTKDRKSIHLTNTGERTFGGQPTAQQEDVLLMIFFFCALLKSQWLDKFNNTFQMFI